MFADLDETLRRLIQAELPVKNGEIEISFDQPRREWSARLSRPTINLFMYDIRENAILRQHQWETMPTNGGPLDIAQRKRSPMRVDVTYLLTTWASEPDDEHNLMGRCLMALFRFPVIPDDRLQGAMQNPPFEIQTRLAVHDRLVNPAELWSALDNEVRPTVPMIITLALDPWSVVEGPLVRSFSMRTAQSNRLPREIAFTSSASEMVYIGGQVRTKSGGDPVAGVPVTIEGRGLSAVSDMDGRFVLGSLPPGEYTLIAQPPQGKSVQRKVTAPGAAGDYDLEVS